MVSLLLVEDTLVCQRIEQLLLKEQGFEVQLASDGKAALAAVAQQQFSVILMDLGLPDSDGIDLIGQIRLGNNLNKDTDIYILTAHELNSTQKSELDSMVQGCFKKPLSKGCIEQLKRRTILT